MVLHCSGEELIHPEFIGGLVAQLADSMNGRFVMPLQAIEPFAPRAFQDGVMVANGRNLIVPDVKISGMCLK